MSSQSSVASDELEQCSEVLDVVGKCELPLPILEAFIATATIVGMSPLVRILYPLPVWNVCFFGAEPLEDTPRFLLVVGEDTFRKVAPLLPFPPLPHPQREPREFQVFISHKFHK